MIQATALPPFCGSLHTFTEALRIFLGGRDSSKCGLLGWCPSKTKCTRWAARGEETALVTERRTQPASPSPRGSFLLAHTTQPHRLQDHRVLGRTMTVILPGAETPAQRVGSLPTRPSCHHVALWGWEVMTGSEEELSAFPL